MSDNMGPDDIYSPHGCTPPPPPKPPSPQTFSDLHGAKDTPIDETPDVEASNPVNEPEPLSSDSPPDPPSSDSHPDPLNVEDLLDATTTPEHPTSKDEEPGSDPSPVGPDDPARVNGESSDVDDEIEIDRAVVPQPQGLVPHNCPPDFNALLRAMNALTSGPQPQTNGETTINNFFILGGNTNVHQTTGPNQPTEAPPQPAVNPPQPAVNPPQPPADIPADEPTSPKASSTSTSTSSNEQETKPAAVSDKGEKIQAIIWGVTLPFRWIYYILHNKYVIGFIAILFSLFVLLPITWNLGGHIVSHAPSYFSHYVLGQGYENGNPFGISYPTWMPSWGGSQNDTVPKMHVVEEAQEPTPLTFRRPIPQVETDILPEVILRYEERLAASNHEHKEALLDNLAESKKRAQDQKKFNQHFIDDMETRSIVQYRRLQALVASVDRILGQLSGTATGGRAAEGGDAWRWLDSRATARQKTLQLHYKRLKTIIDDMIEGRSTERGEINDMLNQGGYASGPNKQTPGLCLAANTLRDLNDAETRDLGSGFNVLCSSEKRTGKRWSQVDDAIKKFKKVQEKVARVIDDAPKDLEQAYGEIRAFAMVLMRVLEEFARLPEGEDQ